MIMANENKLRLRIARPFPEDAVAHFGDFASLDIAYNDIEHADILFGQPSIEEIGRCPSLKWLQITSAGADGYARSPEAFEGIRLTTVSGAFGQSISEWTLALALMLYKRLHLFRDNQNACLWRDEGRQYSPEGKRVLVLGCGDLGTCIARQFKHFHCHTVGLRRHLSLNAPAAFDEVYTLGALEEELSKADIVIGALPETSQTKGLLNEARLRLMRPEAIVINVGRGSLIDSDALADRLRSGALLGAALDVVSREPLPAEHPLWRIPQCILTPHASGGSFGHLAATEKKIYEICRENLRRYLQNQPLLNELDFETGYRKAENRFE